MDEDIRSWLDEDIPYWDVSFHQSEDETVSARVISKQEGIIAGVDVAKRMLELLSIDLDESIVDGDGVKEGDIIMSFTGRASDILRVERTMLNILSHMSGIATYTNKLVGKVKAKGKNTRIAATRKTLPGLRKYQKWAVIIGGGDTHRLDLSSMALIKENHVATYGGVKEAIQVVKDRISFSHKIEIEVRSDEEAMEAAKEGVDIIMLDNYTPDQIQRLLPDLKNFNNNSLIEASGGITEESIDGYIEAGVDIISLGKLTHTVSAFDLSLLFENT